MAAYVPDEGHIVWSNFSSQSGYEQAGRRSAVVLTPKAYNQQRAGLMICAPITNQIKGYLFGVVLGGGSATGAALADQVKSLDWKARRAQRKGQASPSELAEIKAKIKALLKLA